MKFKHLLMLSACMAAPLFAADAAKPVDAAAEPAAKTEEAKDAKKAPAAKKKIAKKHHGHHVHKYHHKKHEPVLCNPVKAVDANATPEGYIKVTDNTFIGIHGYVNAQANYDSAQFAGDYVIPAALAWDGLNDTVGANARINSPARKGQVSGHAKQTRLAFSALQTNTRFGDMKAYIEADFYGTVNGATAKNGLGYTFNEPSVGGSHTLRMRKAYGEIGGFQFGQTTPLFMEVAQANTVDFGGQHDVTRFLQLRYTWKANDMFKWAFALDRPSSDYIEYNSANANGAKVLAVQSVGNGQSKVDHKLPAFDTKATFTFGGGHEFGLRGLVRQIALKDETRTNGASFKKTGWGIGADLKIMTVNKGFIAAAISHGRAIGHYVAEMDGQSVVWDRNPARTRLDAQKQTYWGVGYTQPFCDEWAASLGYSTSFTSKAAGFETGLTVNGTANPVTLDNARMIQTKSADKIFGNIMWTPVKNVDVGLEYMHAIRKGMKDSTVTRSLKGTARRVILAAKYSF